MSFSVQCPPPPGFSLYRRQHDQGVRNAYPSHNQRNSASISERNAPTQTAVVPSPVQKQLFASTRTPVDTHPSTGGKTMLGTSMPQVTSGKMSLNFGDEKDPIPSTSEAHTQSSTAFGFQQPAGNGKSPLFKPTPAAPLVSTPEVFASCSTPFSFQKPADGETSLFFGNQKDAGRGVSSFAGTSLFASGTGSGPASGLESSPAASQDPAIEKKIAASFAGNTPGLSAQTSSAAGMHFLCLGHLLLDQIIGIGICI